MENIRQDIFGYFDEPDSTVIAYDPGTDTICPICGNKLSGSRMTISLFKAYTDKSYFYRVDKSCYESLSQDDKNNLDWSLIDNI